MGDSKDGIGSDKEVDSVLSSILSKVNAVKGSLSALVGKMEHDQLTWPSVLDSFSSFSGHTSNLMKQLGGERLPPLHTRVILPLMVSSDKDYELERQTEGRVPMMHHEVVPNYLRTKLSLELEGKQKERWALANSKQGLEETAGQIKEFNQMLSHALEHVREEEERKAKAGSDSTPNTSAETKKLVAAYLRGAGLSQLSANRRAQLSGGNPMASSGVRLPMLARNTGMRGMIRAEQRQAVAAPYLTSPHKHPSR